jgi:hypothetical protein
VSLRIENRKLRASNTTLKEEVKDASLALEMDLALLNSIQGIASKILMSTKDRFLILTATNGQRLSDLPMQFMSIMIQTQS